MNHEDRIKAMQAVDEAGTFEQEQDALKHARVVDLKPSLPKGAVDLYHQWDDRETDTNVDYSTVCKKVGTGFDRGARRYVIRENKVKELVEALKAEGFLLFM